MLQAVMGPQTAGQSRLHHSRPERRPGKQPPRPSRQSNQTAIPPARPLRTAMQSTSSCPRASATGLPGRGGSLLQLHQSIPKPAMLQTPTSTPQRHSLLQMRTPPRRLRSRKSWAACPTSISKPTSGNGPARLRANLPLRGRPAIPPVPQASHQQPHRPSTPQTPLLSLAKLHKARPPPSAAPPQRGSPAPALQSTARS